MKQMISTIHRHLYDWFIPHSGNNHHPKALHHKHLAAYGYAMVAIKALLVAVLFLSFPTVAHFSTITQARITELVNQSRVSAGLAPLSVNSTLTQAAELKLQDMFEQGYFAHESPSGVAPWEWFKQAGYVYTYAGENLAMNFTEAEEVHAAWIASPTHRANILNPNYSEMGVAVGVGELDGEQVTLVVHHFGKTFVAGAEAPAPSPKAAPAAIPAPQPIPEPAPVTAPVPEALPQPTPIPVVGPSVPQEPSLELPAPDEPDIGRIAQAPQVTQQPLSRNRNLVAQAPAVSDPAIEAGAQQPQRQEQIGFGAGQAVLLEPAAQTGFVGSILRFLTSFHWAILLLLGLALILKVFIHFRIQHHGVIVHTAAILGVGIILLLLELHFLEAISGPVLLF